MNCISLIANRMRPLYKELGEKMKRSSDSVRDGSVKMATRGSHGLAEGAFGGFE